MYPFVVEENLREYALACELEIRIVLVLHPQGKFANTVLSPHQMHGAARTAGRRTEHVIIHAIRKIVRGMKHRVVKTRGFFAVLENRYLPSQQGVYNEANASVLG